MVEPGEVELLVSPPTHAPGNRMQGSALSFQTLDLAIAGNYYKNRPNADDGWRTVTPLCREYSSSRSYPKTKALSAFPEGTIIGPISEVHVVKILDKYGIEVVIQRITNPEHTTYVVISREEERLVNEIHS